MAQPLDHGRLRQALEALGSDLAARGVFIELAIYGGGALILQFEWRRSTWDVDAVVREGFDEAVLAPSVARVAREMDLDSDWLNNAVGMFTPLDEPESLFEVSGVYPSEGPPGLRTLLARPHYLLAMKLRALSSLDRGTRDMDDARALAAHLGIVDLEGLVTLYASIYDEAPTIDARLRFPAILDASP
ncbi:hypothetical protein [Methylobacterium sp. WL120]|uniref:hypothetical protein n=1 Tax=Methylobacterium sp. WL120 TaxID=2603887 RepID=UPI0011C8D9B4|nr:hypothetical protein [Methylobacterium sp. WL120]TXM64108.1 hypothetical protein FV229_19860 [Methylobacterium sp. WL120]